jgi:acyl-CoA reductase-like NAD-dependent aldehyde dehydrogenase/predicted nucleotidyltransferase
MMSKFGRNYADIEAHAASFADHLLKNRRLVHGILRKYQSWEVVEDEIRRSVEALGTLGEVERYFVGSISKVAVFLPLNLPLYSFVLFAAVPSYLSRDVVVRPPERMWPIFSDLYEGLTLSSFFPNISLFSGERRAFIEAHCKTSNAVIFSGKHENFLRVREACGRNILMIFNGVGHNPLVITETADITLAAEKALQVKLFNNGQDCAGPDAILVHAHVADAFERELVRRLKGIRPGSNYKSKKTCVGPLFEPSSLAKFGEITSRVLDAGGHIVYGGTVDYKNNVIYPCICRHSVRGYLNYEEIYSPIFLLGEYADDDELSIYFEDPDQKYARKQMYVSVFGRSSYLERRLPASILIFNLTIHDVERGNEEFGGYGAGASAISYKGITVVKPILVPREIYTYLISPFAAQFSGVPKGNHHPEKYIVESLFIETVKRIFSRDLVFAYIFGSYAWNREKSYSDVDTLVCVKQRDSTKVREYLDWIFEMCEVFGKIPDFTYPAEIVRIEDIKNAAGGFSRLSLKAKSNSPAAYDAMVWMHSLSHYKIGVVNEEAIPEAWTRVFLEHSTRLLNGFLEALRENIARGHIPRGYEKLSDIPEDEKEIDAFIENLGNGRKLVDILKYIPFQSSSPYKEENISLVKKRNCFGRKFISGSFMRIGE